MARKQVVEIKCDRCPRTEYTSEDKVPKKPEGQRFLFAGRFGATKIEYEDLCSVCMQIVSTRFDEIKKELTKMAPDRHSKKQKQDKIETPRPPQRS